MNRIHDILWIHTFLWNSECILRLEYRGHALKRIKLISIFNDFRANKRIKIVGFWTVCTTSVFNLAKKEPTFPILYPHFPHVKSQAVELDFLRMAQPWALHYLCQLTQVWLSGLSNEYHKSNQTKLVCTHIFNINNLTPIWRWPRFGKVTLFGIPTKL